MDEKLEVATFGAGCFWCVEAIFQQVKGVVSVSSGYCNGEKPHPTYEEVCTGTTGHAEVCQIVYQPEQVNFEDLLAIFWQTHDPTTLNRQGADVGTQYRSGIFYHNETQRQIAQSYKQKLEASGIFARPIVTEISPITNYSPAEKYHQNYYNQNGNQPYCHFVIRPKIEKFKEIFKDKSQ